MNLIKDATEEMIVRISKPLILSFLQTCQLTKKYRRRCRQWTQI
jgi:hypothetical protein